MLFRSATPVHVIARLNAAVVRALADADTKARYLNAGVETVGSTPAELAALVKGEMAKWSKLIREAGIQSD